MVRGRIRLSRTGMLALAVALTLGAASSAAYRVGARRTAHGSAAAPSTPVAVTLAASTAPASVAYGGTVVVSGVLRDRAGVPLIGRVVEVLAGRADMPGVAPIVVAAPLTDARGRLVVPFRPAAGSVVRLRFAGEPGGAGQRWLEAAESSEVRVAVVPRVAVSARTRPVDGGWSTVLRGTVRPGPAGGRVALERLVHGGWHGVETARLARAGTFAFTVRTARPGTYRYRVTRAAAGAYGAGSGRYDLRLAMPRAPALPGLPKGTGGPGELLVAGDSLAYYLGQQLATARGKRPTAVDARPSSGLARPEYFDWTAYAQTQVETTPPGAVVVFIGANDCQPLRAGGTGAWTILGSANWVAEYRRRAAGLMRAYVGDAVRPVYWIGLPIAREADIASCYRALNAATAGAAKDVAGVTWIESWSVYAVDGRYNDYVHGVLARQDDGIHLTFAGTRLLTRKVYALLRP